MHNKPEPDTTALQLHRGASPLGGVAQWGALTEQPQLFNLAQTQLTTDDYYTPKWLFDALDVTFDLDVASPPQGPLHTPCHAYYTQADDGLTQPWHGRVWMNPPYSKPLPWVQKWLHHANGMALLPTNGGQWCKLLWDSNAKGVWLGRLAFVRSNHEQKGSPLNIVLWAIGTHNIKAISKVGHVR